MQLIIEYSIFDSGMLRTYHNNFTTLDEINKYINTRPSNIGKRIETIPNEKMDGKMTDLIYAVTDEGRMKYYNIFF